jgi:threonine dehydrogenase-like Zn-dependent dehydrogenase
MRAAVFEGNGRVEVTERPEPSVAQSDDVLIRIAANGLCGSDLRALAVPPQMVYEPGVILGHEFTGTVEKIGKGVTSVTEGERVVVLPNINCQTCAQCRANRVNLCERFVHIGGMRDGGAAEFCVVPARMVFTLPDDLDVELAALTEPLACVLNGTRRAGVQPGDCALILGGGPIGLLYLLLFRGAGANPLIVSEPASDRARVARELGADVVVNPLEEDVAQAVREANYGLGADLAVDTVGSLVGDGVRAVRKAGRVLVFGLNDEAQVELPTSDLVAREISIEGVYIAKGTFPAAIRLLQQNELGFDRLITHRLDLEEFDAAIELSRRGEAVKALVRP